LSITSAHIDGRFVPVASLLLVSAGLACVLLARAFPQGVRQASCTCCGTRLVRASFIIRSFPLETALIPARKEASGGTYPA